MRKDDITETISLIINRQAITPKRASFRPVPANLRHFPNSVNAGYTPTFVHYCAHPQHARSYDSHAPYTQGEYEEMPQRTNEFQQLVYLIQVQAKDRPDMVVTESKMLKDRVSGIERETDIAVECLVTDIPIIVAFECRCRSRKPDFELVEQMVKKHDHLSDKLVLVANLPFTDEATAAALRERADIIVLNEATNTNWVARIDQYTELLLATFDFSVRSFSVEYDCPEGSPRFHDKSMIELADSSGARSSIIHALNVLISTYKPLGQCVIDLWYKQPPAKRASERTITLKYPPPADQPMMLTQGSLSYPLKRLEVTIVVKIGSSPLRLNHTEYRQTRVAYGTANIVSGEFAGQSMRVVMTENQGQRPKAATLLLGSNEATRAQLHTVSVGPAAQPNERPRKEATQ
jgi:hypothetical protein